MTPSDLIILLSELGTERHGAVDSSVQYYPAKKQLQTRQSQSRQLGPAAVAATPSSVYGYSWATARHC